VPKLIQNGEGDVWVKLSVRETIAVVALGMLIVAGVWGPIFLAWQDFTIRAHAIRDEWITRTIAFDDELDHMQRRSDRLRYDICAEHSERCTARDVLID